MEHIPYGIQHNVALATYTTLGVGGFAEYFVEVTSVDMLREVYVWARTHEIPVTILGGGSNVLVSDEGVRGLVVHIALKGIEFHEVGDVVEARVAAGELLDAFVAACVEHGYWGVENLSAIPGTVGAVPVQNVGAYGVEAADIVRAVVVYDTEENIMRTLEHGDCMFSYRDSLFKKTKRYVIVTVIYILSKTPTPKLAYADLQKYFEHTTNPTIAEVRDAVCMIRSEKFPDWSVNGTAGSFFKNPILTTESAMALRKRFPEMPQYPEGVEHTKVSLGWILDRICGLKGYREGNVWLYEKQALVLTCAQPVSATEINAFAEKIAHIVFEVTGISIEREVTALG